MATMKAQPGMFNSEWFKARLAQMQPKTAPLGAIAGSAQSAPQASAPAMNPAFTGSAGPSKPGAPPMSKPMAPPMGAPQQMGRMGALFGSAGPQFGGMGGSKAMPMGTLQGGLQPPGGPAQMERPQPVGGRFVRLTSPDGTETRDVPEEQAEFYLSRGARRL